MKLIIPILLFNVLLFSNAKAQSDTLAKDTTYWQKGALFGVQFAQNAFYQWTAGGENAIALAGLHQSFLNYSKDNVSWDNILDVNYGMIKQGRENLRKTDDRIELNSAYGKNAGNSWFYSGSMNFRTQFAPGLNANNDKISDWFSPAYLSFAVGMNYKFEDIFTANISPLSSKNTFVLNDSLNAIGAFGVEPGEWFRSEFGGQVRLSFKREIFENINLNTRLLLFSNYINNPQNIDINWDALLTFKVNKFFNFSIQAVLIYDDDILVPIDTNGDGLPDKNGKGIQFKEVLSMGLSFKI